MPKPRRVESIRIMLTAAEKRDFVRMAAERKTDISELVRQVLHRELAAESRQEVA